MNSVARKISKPKSQPKSQKQSQRESLEQTQEAQVLKDGNLVLVTGAARSGKSGWAESLAEQSSRPVTYIATARPLLEDAEWSDRIQQHRDRRPRHWTTQEVPEALAESLGTTTVDQCLLIDSLGTWVANWIEQPEASWQSTAQTLCKAIHQCPALVILVTEETGWGVVPAYALGRRFRDRLGQLSQTLGSQAEAVYLVTAGHVLPLHQLGVPLVSVRQEKA